MRIRHIDIPTEKAEGKCRDFPYNTNLVSAEGVQIHFWVGAKYDVDQVADALSRARNARDIVSATWSFGEPSGYWTNQDIT